MMSSKDMLTPEKMTGDTLDPKDSDVIDTGGHAPKCQNIFVVKIISNFESDFGNYAPTLVQTENTEMDIDHEENYPDDGDKEENTKEDKHTSEDDCIAKKGTNSGIQQVGSNSSESVVKTWKMRPVACPICGKNFGRHTGVKLHLQVVHTILKIFPCEICSQVFCAYDDRTKHIENKHPVDSLPPLTCKICSKQLQTKGSMRSHMRRHELSFQCKFCKNLFKSEVSLTEHIDKCHTEAKKKEELKISTRGSEPRFHCHLCTSSSFWNSKDWKQHYLEVHKTQEVYPCGICNRAYRSTKLRDIHVRSHTGEKPFICQNCPARFASKESLRNHRRVHTGQFSCKECGTSFSSNNTLEQHIRSHTGEKPFICDYCGKGFVTRNGLVFHHRLHTGEKPYSCQICDYKCPTTMALKSHKAAHTTERPYVCEECGKAFKLRGWLKEHQKTHSGEKGFVCDLCDHAFFTKYQLTLHKRTHSGERPHTCDICSKAFVRRDGLTEHRRTHTKELAYSCELCMKCFMSRKSLRTHSCSPEDLDNLKEIEGTEGIVSLDNLDDFEDMRGTVESEVIITLQD